MLCSKCKGCLQTEACLTTAQASHSLAHHQTYQSLEQAIDAGCYICNRFWEALNAQEHVLLSSTVGEGVEPSGAYCSIESVQHYLTSTSLDDGKSYGHPGCYLLQVAYNKPAITTCFRASFLLEPVECANTNLARQSLAQSTQSPETLSLAKDWVRECTAHHERCKRPVGEKPWYPTRLLSFDLPEASIVRLLETNQITPVGQYMTLTHRWGPVDHIILTKETYPQLLEGLPLSTLPQLFRDAVSICRHLGVGYIWIDSLCIFQGNDNIGDWQHEALLMKNVYSNSFCNISAADTPNCSQSIFNSRDPRLLNPQVVELTLCGEGSSKITERFVLSDYSFWKSEVSNALVNKRGWVLQERFLAPRILHFSKRQLIWECCEKDAAEVYPDGLPLALSTSLDARFKQMDSSDYTGRVDRYRYREADGNSAPHLLWLRIVELYTASALTVPSDKLIACSGIAKRVAEIVQDDYVAGMWRRYLEGELLWMVQGNHQPGRWTRPREYRAPSWSWASIDGPITPGEPRIQDSLITVEDYHLDYWTSDKTAAIRGGWLRLRGVLKKTTLARKSSTPGGGYHWDMTLDNERVNVLEDASPGNTEPRVMLDILQEDFKEENAKGLLFSMCARSKAGDGRELQWSNAKDIDLAVDNSRDGLHLWQAMTNEQLHGLEAILFGKDAGFYNFEIDAAADLFTYNANMIDKFHTELIAAKDDSLQYIIRQPGGICAGICPFNGVIITLAMKAAPGLACGNSIIIKTSKLNPFSTLFMVSLATQVRIPPDTLNCLIGGPDVDEALSSHMDISKISFTGSIKVGKLIQVAAANSNLKSATLELGGKSPLIVFPDADLERALQPATMFLLTNGQGCASPTRLYVHESIANEFIAKLKDIVEEHGRNLNWNKGTTLLTGGKPIGAKGCYVEPTIFVDPHPDAKVLREEIFGPVLVVVWFSTEDEVIRLANDNEFGLAPYVWTADLSRALRLSQKLEAGTVSVNGAGGLLPNVPRGRWMQSVQGTENGKEAMLDWTQLKSVAIKG
ncbi:hypothetical protein ACKRZS_003916 [Fusarium odoratissimum]